MSGLTPKDEAAIDRHLAAITGILRSLPDRRDRDLAIRALTRRLDEYTLDLRTAQATGTLTAARRVVKIPNGELSRSELLELADSQRRTPARRKIIR